MTARLDAEYRGGPAFEQMSKDVLSAEAHLDRLGKKSANPRAGLDDSDLRAGLSRAEKKVFSSGNAWVLARIKGVMCAQLSLKEEKLPSREATFRDSHLLPNGDRVRFVPADGDVASAVHTAPSDDSIESKTTPVVRGTLAAFTHFGELRVAMNIQIEPLPDGSMRSRFFDEAKTLKLEFHTSPDEAEGSLNIRVQYVDKPLDASLLGARFLEVLATQPGELYMELYEPSYHKFLIAELPLAVPEQKLEEFRDRVRVLDGLHEIWVDTGVEIRYPKDTEGEEGLRNFNIVLAAIRSGWVVQQVADFSVHLPTTAVRAFLDESRDNKGEVHRAFVFDAPNESYRVFGKQVDLGPTRRYISAGRLATSEEEMEAWLGKEPKEEETLELKWEPHEGTPMHVFFEEWPTSSIRSVDRELREFEAVYGVSSQHFGRAWEKREPWAREVPDGKRWLSLTQAREELMGNS